VKIASFAPALWLSLNAATLACQGPGVPARPIERAAAHAEPKATAVAEAPAAAARPPLTHLKAEGQLGPGSGVLLIDLAPPAGAKLTLDAPVSALGSGGIGLDFPRRLNGPLGQQGMPLRLPIEVADGATGPAQVEVSYYWCTDGNEAACRRELAVLSIDLDLTGSSAGGEAHLSHRAQSTN